MPDARLEVIGNIHSASVALSVMRLPDLLPRLRNQNLSLDRFGHFLLVLDSVF